MSARHVTDATFTDDVLLSDKPVLVDFWAAWCPPCRAVAPILDQLATEHADKIEIVKLNIDENPETAAQYGITSIPTMKVFQGGKAVKTVVGALPKPAIEAELAPYLT
ncbi:thioredoxin [Streptomyces sp. DT2A-34]|uniref:thioredoxin n=1 Tax=Streptomyces sp. DT2A-34 TaxID=3051182 RepID=UPI00265C8A7E|nr:thioredoxin [Streptomyces sp. DT2A-34]MDO0916713.1 thioredoxin [Streptomyces sp. DT2A-34]